MAHIGFTELSENLAHHFDQVEHDHSHLVVTRQGHPEMAVLLLSELESMMETLHLLGTPANARRLMRSVAQLDAGGGVARDLIEPGEHVPEPAARG